MTYIIILNTELHEAFDETMELYVWTKRDRKYPNRKQISRKAKNGHWWSSSAAKNIKDASGKIIGHKRALVYHEGESDGKDKGRKTNWLMSEYTLAHSSTNSTTPEVDLMNVRVYIYIYI